MKRVYWLNRRERGSYCCGGSGGALSRSAAVVHTPGHASGPGYSHEACSCSALWDSEGRTSRLRMDCSSC